MKNEKIKKFEKVINENKSGMLQIMILYCMSCHENYKKLNNEQKENILSFLYCLYLKDESNTDIAIFSDIIMEKLELFFNNEITRENIYNYL